MFTAIHRGLLLRTFPRNASRDILRNASRDFPRFPTRILSRYFSWSAPRNSFRCDSKDSLSHSTRVPPVLPLGIISEFLSWFFLFFIQEIQFKVVPRIPLFILQKFSSRIILEIPAGIHPKNSRILLNSPAEIFPRFFFLEFHLHHRFFFQECF